ncbi:hypothetical protein DDE74_35810 [Streptomyces lydicus]|uniref:Uncharacterized protein n=1 Tax=Streptomyces lydicus TaxID=47763 RepID=A0A3S9YKQ6_9ACTN|nr:hypothetical protein [Streptomyces lydicus]AZS75551.1 hypothetical protein DDE74_35810 [Streptomyces lydicus]
MQVDIVVDGEINGEINGESDGRSSASLSRRPVRGTVPARHTAVPCSPHAVTRIVAASDRPRPTADGAGGDRTDQQSP